MDSTAQTAVPFPSRHFCLTSLRVSASDRGL